MNVVYTTYAAYPAFYPSSYITYDPYFVPLIYPFQYYVSTPYEVNRTCYDNLKDLGDCTPLKLKSNLDRFVKAQNDSKYNYSEVKKLLEEGKKEGDWIWYIFPQLKGLGSSEMSRKYGIRSIEEAQEYLKHSNLGSRLVELTKIVIGHLEKGKTIEDIMGSDIDVKKFRSSMTLFTVAAQKNNDDNKSNTFKTAICKAFPKEEKRKKYDLKTLDILRVKVKDE